MQTENSAGVEQGLPYVIFKDGHGNEHKVIDLEKVAPTEGVVIFEATTRKNGLRATEVPFKSCKDGLTGVLIGICTGIDPATKRLSWRPIYLDKQKMFNCEIRDEAWAVACLLRSNIVEGSPNLSKNQKLNLFRVHDENKKAAIDIQRIKDAQRAVSIAESLTGDKLKDMAFALNINTQHTNELILMAQMLKLAEKNPIEFLRVYESPGREKIIVFKKALDLGLITHDPMTGYYHNGILLGVNEVYVSDYFEKYPEHFIAIKQKIEIKSKDTVQAKKITADPEKLALQRQIEELKAQLAGKQNESPDWNDRLAKAKAEAERLGGKMKQGLHQFQPNEESVTALEKKIEVYKETAGV